MKLNDLLPTTFNYRDTEVDIDLSFDNVLDVFDVLDMKDDLMLSDILELSLVLLFGENVIEEEDYTEVWNTVFDLYFDSKEKEFVQYDLAGNAMPTDTEEEQNTINLEQDAEYIFASFYQAYKINLLREQAKLHWVEFRALLKGLPDDTVMKQIVKIRSWKPSEHDTLETKEEMKKLQEYYRLD